jgi:hypothetical protein
MILDVVHRMLLNIHPLRRNMGLVTVADYAALLCRPVAAWNHVDALAQRD